MQAISGVQLVTQILGIVIIMLLDWSLFEMMDIIATHSYTEYQIKGAFWGLAFSTIRTIAFCCSFEGNKTSCINKEWRCEIILHSNDIASFLYYLFIFVPGQHKLSVSVNGDGVVAKVLLTLLRSFQQNKAVDVSSTNFGES